MKTKESIGLWKSKWICNGDRTKCADVYKAWLESEVEDDA